MRIVFFILIFILSISYGVKGQNQSQCDSIYVVGIDFDKIFQDKFKTIKSDTMLAVRHCNNTNGCRNPYGIMYWHDQSGYHSLLMYREIKTLFRYITLYDKIKTSEKISVDLKRHLDQFIADKTYTFDDEISRSFINHAPVTKVLFKTKEVCWHYKVEDSRIGNEEVEWIKWAEELNALVRKEKE
jgi:hypothetical protein